MTVRTAVTVTIRITTHITAIETTPHTEVTVSVYVHQSPEVRRAITAITAVRAEVSAVMAAVRVLTAGRAALQALTAEDVRSEVADKRVSSRVKSQKENHYEKNHYIGIFVPCLGSDA